ncbi:4-hydroxy-tetrahydrodipicolinate synthase [Candidatus Peregrinibacteria bacterium]|nr:4-hydroxy-tetrahydrodipicolinate synthase [Candidatus Peregrinibacteria bacterium]
MLPQKLFGSFVAIVTPFNEDGSLDETSYRNLLRWHLQAGTNGIVACGTTGENATLTTEERERVIKIAIEECASKIPVIGGIASNNTAEAVRQAQWVKNLGVDATLVLAPYYNKPPAEGLFQHFKAVAEVGNPIIVYNVPGRTGVNISPEVVIRLAKEIAGVIAVKEASGNPGQFMEILRAIAAGTQSWKSPNFVLLLGDDAVTLPFIPLGATGCISVVANETPREFSEMIAAALAGDYQKASQLHFKILQLMNVNFIETNPLPVKTALALMGKIKPVFRLPLVPMQPANIEKLKKVLMELQLI